MTQLTVRIAALLIALIATLIAFCWAIGAASMPQAGW